VLQTSWRLCLGMRISQHLHEQWRCQSHPRDGSSEKAEKHIIIKIVGFFNTSSLLNKPHPLDHHVAFRMDWSELQQRHNRLCCRQTSEREIREVLDISNWELNQKRRIKLFAAKEHSSLSSWKSWRRKSKRKKNEKKCMKNSTTVDYSSVLTESWIW
jgi:hypothetical protein